MPETSIPDGEIRQESPDAPHLHPDANGYGRSIEPYTVRLPQPEGYLPPFLTPAQREIRGFRLQGRIGGR